MFRAMIGIVPSALLVLCGMLLVALPFRWAKLLAVRCARWADWCVGGNWFPPK